jgi:hypothetical protein
MRNYAGHRLAPWLAYVMASQQETARALLTPGEVTRRARPDIGRDPAARFRLWDRRGLIRSVDSVLVRRDAFLDELATVATPRYDRGLIAVGS